VTCPELRAILAEAYDLATDGEKLMLPRALTAASNLRTTFTKIVTRAGHKPWPRLFQNLRASCATDWVERCPNHVVAKWLGHSPLIAAAHYLQAREQHFEDAVSGGAQGGTESTAGQAPATEHICVQSEAAASRSAPHETAKLSRKRPIVRSTASRCNPRQNA
jgi:hypothetical protein